MTVKKEWGRGEEERERFSRRREKKMYRGKRGKAREDSETHRHAGLSLHKKREQLKESRDTSEA